MNTFLIVFKFDQPQQISADSFVLHDGWLFFSIGTTTIAGFEAAGVSRVELAP